MLLCMTSLICSCYDDTKVWEELHNHDQRISAMESLCAEINANLQSLEVIISSIAERDYVTNVAPIIEDGQEVGYVISFYQNHDIKIYFGADEEGMDAPSVGIKADENGVYYWTIDNDWLLDDEGEMINVIRNDGAKS